MGDMEWLYVDRSSLISTPTGVSFVIRPKRYFWAHPSFWWFIANVAVRDVRRRF